MHPGDPILLLAQIGLIIAISRVVGWAFARLHQPPVVGLATLALWQALGPGGESQQAIERLKNTPIPPTDKGA